MFAHDDVKRGIFKVTHRRAASDWGRSLISTNALVCLQLCQLCPTLMTHNLAVDATFSTDNCPQSSCRSQKIADINHNGLNRSVDFFSTFYSGLRGATTARTTSWMMSVDDVRI